MARLLPLKRSKILSLQRLLRPLPQLAVGILLRPVVRRAHQLFPSCARWRSAHVERADRSREPRRQPLAASVCRWGSLVERRQRRPRGEQEPS